MRILHLEGVEIASHLRWSGAEIFSRRSEAEESGRGMRRFLETTAQGLPQPQHLASCCIGTRGTPPRKHEVQMGSASPRGKFVEKAISSLKLLGTQAYQTQAKFSRRQASP